MTVVTTAPSYLFWRCAPPELRVPREFMRGARRRAAGRRSRSARTARRRRGRRCASSASTSSCLGECEEVVVAARRAGKPGEHAGRSPFAETARSRACTGGPHASRFIDLPALRWPDEWVARHHHHHHRFDAKPDRARAPRSRRRAAAPTLHLLRQGSISATRYRRRDARRRARRDRPADRAGRRVTSTSSTRSSCRRAPLLRRWSAAASSSACRPASTCGSRTCWSCSGAPAASRSRPASRA